MRVPSLEGIVCQGRISETKMVNVSLFQCLKKLLNVVIVFAAQSIANVVKSSLGPLGLDKMLVDNIGVR